MTTTKRLASDRSVWGRTPGAVLNPVVGWLVYDGDEDYGEVTIVRLPAVDEDGFHLARRRSPTEKYDVGLGLTRTGKLRRGGWVSVESDTGRTGWFKSVDRSFYERRK